MRVMKRLLVALSLATIPLYGCHNGNLDSSINEEENWKAQEIVVLKADESTVVKRLSQEVEIVHFIGSLQLDQWKVATLPKGLTLLGTFSFNQEETVKFGHDGLSSKENHRCDLLYYEDRRYVTLKVIGFQIHFEIPPHDARELQSYFTDK